MASTTYGIKELLSNMLTYIKDQFAVYKENNTKTLGDLRKLRVIDRNYLNARLKLVQRSISEKTEVVFSTEQSISLGNFAAYGTVNKKYTCSLSKDKKGATPGYTCYGVVGWSTNKPEVLFNNIYVTARNSKKSSVSINIFARNVTNQQVQNATVNLILLWGKSGIPYSIDYIKLSKGSEEK